MISLQNVTLRNAMITLKNVIKTYISEDSELKALDNINLEIADGAFVVILGQSGCGKSTLLNILGGMDKPTSGQILVDGQDLSSKKSDQLATYRQKSVGMIFQKFNLINDMSVLENVMVPLKFAGLSESEQKRIALEAIEKVGLAIKAKSIPAKLSGGQQQRVAIARALVNNPKILLCDEPTGNLDSKTGEEIIELLRKLNKGGQTIIMVTHNEGYAAFADHVIKMLDGKVIFEKKKDKGSKEAENESGKNKNMSLVSSIKLAFKNVKRRKFRVFLTSFGISVGAMAILVLVSFGAGLQNEATKSMKAFSQTTSITVNNSKVTGANFRSRAQNYVVEEKKPLNDTNINEFKQIANVTAVFPAIRLNGELRANNAAGRLMLSSILPLSQNQDSVKDLVKFGRYFESDDEQSIVVPYGLAQALGYEKGEESIGKEATIVILPEQKEMKATIVGVFGADEPAFQAYIPLNPAIALQKQIKANELAKENPDLYDGVTVVAKDNAAVDGINKTITDKGYDTHSYADTAKEINRIFAMLQIGLGIVGAVAMFVASLGIINTMTMSILERTREIGVMKAVGARVRDIRNIFVTEAAFIGLIGGLFGLILGYPGSKIAAMVFNSMIMNQTGGQKVDFYIAPYLSLGVVAFSILIAILAGYFPARRGAKLDPVSALREE